MTPSTAWLLLLTFTATAATTPPGASPTLSLERDARACRPGAVYQVAYRVAWPGAADAYVVSSPVWPGIDWGTARCVSGHAVASGDDSTVTYVVEVVPKDAGRFVFPAVTVGVAGTDGTEEELRAEPFELVVRDGLSWGWWIVGGIVAGLALGVVFVRQRRRRRVAEPVPVSPYELGHAALHRARKARLDGDADAFYVHLREALDLAADDETTALRAEIEGHAARVRFGEDGVEDAVMDSDWRAAEAAVARLKQEVP